MSKMSDTICLTKVFGFYRSDSSLGCFSKMSSLRMNLGCQLTSCDRLGIFAKDVAYGRDDSQLSKVGSS